MPAETSLPSADPRRKTGDSAYLLQLVLSDKYRHVELELLFFLGIASLEERIAHTMVNPWSIKSPSVSVPFTGPLLPGEKDYTPPLWHPSFLAPSPDPEGTEQKKNYGVYHLDGKQSKRIYTIGPKRRVYTIKASDPKRKKKGGFPRWWCVLFSSLF